MGIDASIYSNLKPVEMPNIFDNAQKGLALSQLAMQNQASQRQIQSQQAIRDAYAKNIGPDGKLNQQGVLSDLAKSSPEAMMQQQEHFTKTSKDQGEAAKSQAEAAHQVLSVAAPVMNDLSKMPEDQRAAAFPAAMKQLADLGVPIHNVPTANGQPVYDPGWFRQTALTVNQMKEHLDNQKTQAETANAQANADKTRSETIKRQPDVLGQTDDPAKLVPGMVPKEHQASVFKEIDAAENTKRMSEEIMKSFNGAAQDNTILKTGAGFLRTPATVMALHQALQPTFKDLEGTVRQAAMDNTFKNVTPAPGDSDKTIETKRQALAEYLQSKASAPTARAYGIDLAKYDSTSAYKSPAKPAQNQSNGMVNSAYAADLPKHGQEDQGYVFLGGNPADPKSWKKAR